MTPPKGMGAPDDNARLMAGEDLDPLADLVPAEENLPPEPGGAQEDTPRPPPQVDHGKHAAAVLQLAANSGNFDKVYTDADALRGIVRPGEHAGEVERLLAQLPHLHRTAMRRAGRAIVATERAAGPAAIAVRTGPPLLVEHGKTWWVFDGSSYFAVDRSVAPVEVGRLHNVTVTVPTGEDGQRQMSPVELYDRYGVTAKKVRWTYNAQGASWNASTRVLDIPGARVCEGPARWSERAERWLSLLVDKTELLLDWLATAPMLDRPTSAVQIKGPDSIGKAMLTDALTTWLGGRVSYAHATGDYSAGLIHGPLVVLDEGVAESRPDAFRSITANREHQVMAKYRMPEELVGCPRVLITSNENDPQQLGREELSIYSELALGRRILVFEGRAQAAAYLAELGGWDATDGWTDPDGELVCHLRWLAKTRKVTPGKRFLVEGDAAAWVASAHLRTGVAGEVVQAFVAYEDLVEDNRTNTINDPQPFHYDPDRPGFVGVNVGGLQTNWKALVGDARPPSHQRLSQALRRLSGQEQPSRFGPKNDRGPRVYFVEVAKLTLE